MRNILLRKAPIKEPGHKYISHVLHQKDKLCFLGEKRCVHLKQMLLFKLFLTGRGYQKSWNTKKSDKPIPLKWALLILV